MTYFKDFPRVLYTFGNEENADAFENIALYSDAVDQVRDAVGLYEDYYIQSGERPDQVSFKLYESTNFHWTFFLMNPSLRECGWPLSNSRVDDKARHDYTSTIMTTRTRLSDKFKIGREVNGLTSGASALIEHRDLQLGQVWIKNISGTFLAGETVTSTNAEGITENITLLSIAPQYNSAHHYEDVNKEYVDIDPEVGPGAQLTEITWLDRLLIKNEEMRQIRVIDNKSIIEVAQAFKEAIRS